MMPRKTLVLFAVTLVALGGALALLADSPTQDVEAGNRQIPLQKPLLDGPMVDNWLQSLLDNEAGIAAYAQISPFTISAIRGVYRTIEIETSDYILGSINPPNNPEQHDVHVYAHKSGWLLAYYLRDVPAVNIFDWYNYTGSPGNPTRFQSTLKVITIQLGRPDPTLTYYDFRYPNATNLLLAVEDTDVRNTEESFQILDTSYVYYESSWMLGGTNGHYNAYAKYELDGNEIWRFTGNNVTAYNSGFLSSHQLPPGVPHTVLIYSYASSASATVWLMGALAVVYGPQQ